MANIICGWANCAESCQHPIPLEWKSLELADEPTNPANVTDRHIDGEGVLADCWLCPVHVAELQSKLKPSLPPDLMASKQRVEDMIKANGGRVEDISKSEILKAAKALLEKEASQ